MTDDESTDLDPFDTDTAEEGNTFWVFHKSERPIPGAQLYGVPPGDGPPSFLYRIAQLTLGKLS